MMIVQGIADGADPVMSRPWSPGLGQPPARL
jgi:hypothetical protein